jgi:mono/diheme cytochrome c family protein
MGRLTPLILLATVFTLHSCGNSPEVDNQDNKFSDAKFQSEMAQIYGFKCAICHGKTGVSVIRTAPNLTETTMSKDEVVAIIKYGKNTMPPQKDVLDSKTIQGLAEYITIFQD